MRITENYHDCNEYSSTVQKRVLDVFEFTTQINQARKLLNTIRNEAHQLQKILCQEDKKKNDKALSLFQARMQATVYYTLKNIDKYQNDGWEILVDWGEVDGD